jgi:hypothetical protein
MRLKFFAIFSTVCFLTGCSSCDQAVEDATNIENQTNQDLDLEVRFTSHDESERTTNVHVPATALNGNYKIRAYSIRRDPYPGKATTVEPSCGGTERYNAIVYLTASSFTKVKNCLDIYHFQSVFVDLAATCPAGTEEQLAPQ